MRAPPIFILLAVYIGSRDQYLEFNAVGRCTEKKASTQRSLFAFPYVEAGLYTNFSSHSNALITCGFFIDKRVQEA